MKLKKAIVRPEKIDQIKDTLTELHLTGMTVTDVRGHGRQKGHKAVYRGTEYSVTLLPKIMLDLVIPDERVDEVLKKIMTTARTGEIGAAAFSYSMWPTDTTFAPASVTSCSERIHEAGERNDQAVV